MSSEFRQRPYDRTTPAAPPTPRGESLASRQQDKGISSLRPQDSSTPTVLATFISDVRSEHAAVGEVLDRYPWAYSLLERFGEVAPRDLQSSLRVSEITEEVLKEINVNPEAAFTAKDTDRIIVAGALSDVGRSALDEETLYEVFTSGKRWRDDPEAWQWDVVRGHPEDSARLVEEAGGDPEVVAMVGHHHSLKRENPYGATPIEDVKDPLVRRGVEIIAAVDVAEAVSRKFTGEGRGYLDDREFAGRQLQEIVTSELDVHPWIAELAAKHTLEVKMFGREHESNA